MTVKETVKEISKDEVFFFHSGGGLTVSGGEPLMQAEFVSAVLKECKQLGIHTAIETSLYVPFENIEKVLPWLDVLYVDIKQMDAALHKEWTGSNNTLILNNISKVDKSEYPLEVIVRIPLIPGANDSDINLSATAKFCRELSKLKEIELLAYHRLGRETYKYLGRTYELADVFPPSPQRIWERGEFLAAQSPGLQVKVGSGFVGKEQPQKTRWI